MQPDLVQWIFFVVFAALVVGPAILVVTVRNLFHSALWLLVSLFGVAGLFAMLAAPFLAVVQVMVYIGAIVILIIIAIMLTRRVMGLQEVPNRQWPYGLAAALLAFVIMALVLVLAFGGEAFRTPLASVPDNSIAQLGAALVDTGQYTIPFLLAAVFLTGAMIGAIVIAREDE
ncbi:MAG: NADH-quinone oxidoreductase subunit J [Anaerolineae bacterium]|nr:NADH-quinone oxidoreductase subunit J [Anaerolineae bacterium]